VTSGYVSDTVIEAGDIENVDVRFGILFIAVLCAEIVLLSFLGGRYIYFRYNAISRDITDNTIEQLDLENMGMAVGILLQCPRTRDMMWASATNDNKRLGYFRFLRRHKLLDFWNVVYHR